MLAHSPRSARLQNRLSLIVIVGLLTLAHPRLEGTSRAYASGDVGYPDFAYSTGTTGATAPTGDKPQSKLWFNDGSWWACLFNLSKTDYHIYRLDWATQQWIDTGTRIDERISSRADVLWDGAHLFVATAGPSAITGHAARILRYSYDTLSKTYTLDTGFPVTITNGGMEAVVLDKDSTGKLWATYTSDNGLGGRNVYVTHSTDDDRTWVAPYVLSVAGANNLTSDDISAVVAFNSKIGVMWSNMTDGAMYFATHADGTGDDQWVVSPALQGPKYADDHINLKSLQADASGQVFAAVKTSLTAAEAPLLLLLVLKETGSWSRHTFGKVADNHTRPIVLIDSEHRTLYMFAAAPCCNGGTIYYKQTGLDHITFPTGPGMPFIQSSAHLNINNPTSTKQALNGDTGLVVLAGNDPTHYYLHNAIDLRTRDATAPETTIESGPSGATRNSAADFSFSSDEPGATFECSRDGAAFSVCTSPTQYTGLADGLHTFEVRAVDGVGNTDPTPATRSWTVDTVEPDTTIDVGPTGTVDSNTADFSFSSDEPDATFECSRDGAAFSVCASPTQYTGLADAPHTFTVRAVDAAGNVDPMPAEQSWTVEAAAPMVVSVAPANGAEAVAIAANVEAVFSEAMDPTTLTTSSFTLVQKGTTTPIVATVTYDPATRKARLNPSVDLRDGTYYIVTIQGGAGGAADLAGKPLAANKVWTFMTIDLTQPQVKVTSPANGSTVYGKVNVTASASDNVGVTAVRFYVDGKLLSSDSAAPYGVVWNAQKEGSYVLYARAVDAAGNVRQSPSINVTVRK